MGLAKAWMASRCRKLKGRMSSRPMRWSECECVKRTKSSRGMGNFRSCKRRSGDVSIRKYFPNISIFTDCRSRLLRGSLEVQTVQAQPMTGTPVLVPLPRKVIRMAWTVNAQFPPPRALTPDVRHLHLGCRRRLGADLGVTIFAGVPVAADGRGDHFVAGAAAEK